MTTDERGERPVGGGIKAFGVAVGAGVLPMLIAWRWNWPEAVAYAAVSILGFSVTRWLAGLKQPGLLVERWRMTSHENIAPWDKVLAPVVVLGSVLLPLAAGLEARFGRLFEFGWPANLAALGVIVAGYGIGGYALVVNRFFSGVVRIQSERGHQVVTGGPYRWVRHPGYAGTFLVTLAVPVLLDAPWAFLPTAVVIVALAVRTRLEDCYLQENLEGYRAYAQRVRYRLLPGVW